jgi:hypothetical protein
MVGILVYSVAIFAHSTGPTNSSGWPGDSTTGDVNNLQDHDQSYYSKCILEASKDDKGRLSGITTQACKIQATPQMCRNLSNKIVYARDIFNRADPRRYEKTTDRHECWKKCQTEGYWSRNFGECSPG